jgi:hypothetical protein
MASPRSKPRSGREHRAAPGVFRARVGPPTPGGGVRDAAGRGEALRAIEELSGPTRADVAEVQETLRVAIRRWFRREVGKRPTVLPVVLEL